MTKPDDPENGKRDLGGRRLYFDVVLRRKALAQEPEKMRLERTKFEVEQRKSSWGSPLVVSIIAGALALFGNALALFGNGLTAYWKSDADLKTEAVKQQGNLVLESIKTGDSNRARENLQLIAKAKLLGSDSKEAAILDALKDGLRPSLPTPGSNQLATAIPINPETTLLDTNNEVTAPAISCLKGLGVKYVARYYSTNTAGSKVLRSSEAVALGRAGIKIAVVFEVWGGIRGELSGPVGNDHASFAVQWARNAIKQPSGSPIFFAVDFNASPSDIKSQIIPYFNAIKDVVQRLPIEQRYKVGVYGSGDVIAALQEAGLVDYSWLGVNNWNGTREFRRSGNWDFQQTVEETVCGLSADHNAIRSGLEVDKVMFTVDGHQ